MENNKVRMWRFWQKSIYLAESLGGFNFNGATNLLAMQRKLRLASRLQPTWRGALFSFLGVGFSTAIMFSLGVALYNVNMVYMLLTLCATVWFGLATGVLVATLSFLCFDYFFIPPIFTFIIDAVQGWIAIFLFLGTALFANQVAGRARINNYKAEQRAQEITTLYALATTVITQINHSEMLYRVLQQVCAALDAHSCTLFLASPETVELELKEVVHIDTNKENENENKDGTRTEAEKVEQAGNHSLVTQHPDLNMVQAVFTHNKAAFFSIEPYTTEDVADTSNVTKSIAYLPLASSSRQLGVLVIIGRRQPQFSSEEQRLLEVFANHVALAVEHARLIEETAQVATLRDSDRFKSTLLTSVSHELRTPLTAVKTALGNLLAQDIQWSVEEHDEFLSIIEQETDRLTRLVSNLLDLTKIEGGVLKPNFGWHFLPEIVEEVVERLQTNLTLAKHPVSISFTPNIPLTRMDYLELDQVLTNLLENAAKYSEQGRPIEIHVDIKPHAELHRNLIHTLITIPDHNSRQAVTTLANSSLAGTASAEAILVQIIDEGMGIPTSQLERVFDKFYRVQNEAASKITGTGIGLAIARGIIEAHGGEIWAENRLYGGTIFSFSLPIVSAELQHSPLAD
jgi:two-component system sensor histidine kinase KdpD